MSKPLVTYCIRNQDGEYYLAEKSKMRNLPDWSAEREDAMEYELDEVLEVLEALDKEELHGKLAAEILHRYK